MLRLHKSRFEEMERMRKRSNALMFAEGVLIGTALGVVAGILLAPDRGEDTRHKILDEMNYLKERTKSIIPGCCCDEECFEDEVYEDEFEETYEDEELAVEDFEDTEEEKPEDQA